VLPSIVSRIGSAAKMLPVIGLLAGFISVAPVMAESATSPGALTVTETNNNAPLVGQPLSLTITVTNTAATPAGNVLLGASLPSGARISQLPLANNCTRGGGGGISFGFLCFVGALDPGASSSVTYSIVPTTTSIASQASASGFVDGSFAINSVSLLLGTTPTPTDVQVTGFSGTGSPAPGAPFEYVFQVKNNGPQLASGVTFTDSLPAGEGLNRVDAFSLGGATCTSSGTSVSCSLGDLAVGTSALVIIGATAPTAAGTYTNSASVASSIADANPTNNKVSVTIQVK